MKNITKKIREAVLAEIEYEKIDSEEVTKRHRLIRERAWEELDAEIESKENWPTLKPLF